MAASSTDYTLCRLQPGHVHLPMLRQIYQGNVRLALAEEARADVLASQETVWAQAKTWRITLFAW